MPAKTSFEAKKSCPLRWFVVIDLRWFVVIDLCWFVVIDLRWFVGGSEESLSARRTTAELSSSSSSYDRLRWEKSWVDCCL